MNRHFITALIASGSAIALTLQARATTTILDWLQMAPGSTTTTFQWLDDSSNTAASGLLSVAQGFAFPNPAPMTLESQFWDTPPDFNDSETGTATVSGAEFRVAPSGGAAAFSIQLELMSGVSYVLMIANMFSSPEGATSGAILTTLSDAGAFPISSLGTAIWDDGIKPLDQAVVWNAATRTLSPDSGANGESRPAFFAIDPASRTNPRLIIDVPEAYALGSGDAILIGLAVVVPEPSSLLMVLASTGLLMRRRR